MFVPLRDINPSRTLPFVNYALLLSNVAAFLYMLSLMQSGATWLVPGYGLVPARITADPIGEAFTIFTSMFMHGGVAHIASNMMFLHIFGDNIEDALGHLRYFLFYLLCGVCAAIAQILVSPGSHIPMIGASGAVAGVVGAYLVLHPRAPILVFNSVLPLWFFIGIFPTIPAWFVAGEFFVVNLLQGVGALAIPGMMDGGGVAFFAHLGGFLAGLLVVKFWAKSPRRVAPRWQNWHSQATGRGRR